MFKFDYLKELREDKTKTNHYVVSPVKGNAVLLYKMLSKINTNETLAANDKIILCGDVLGSNSTTILQMIEDYNRKRPHQIKMLKGKAEHQIGRMSRSFITSPEGTAIVRSHTRTGYNKTSLLDIKKFAETRRLCQKLPSWIETDCFFISHGGADPSKPLTQQTLDGVIWMGTATGAIQENKEPKHWDKIVLHCTKNRDKVHVTKSIISLPEKDNKLFAVHLDDTSKNVVEQVYEVDYSGNEQQT
jgi:hypothetical protein